MVLGGNNITLQNIILKNMKIEGSNLFKYFKSFTYFQNWPIIILKSNHLKITCYTYNKQQYHDIAKHHNIKTHGSESCGQVK